ncbi:MAG: hypothetical protein RL562_236 [Planctomycetota bacterium]
MTHGFHFGYFAVGLVFFGRALLACAGLRRVPYLPEDASAGAEPTGVTVLVATRGDAMKVCLADLERQRGVDLDIRVVGEDDVPPPAHAVPMPRDRGVPWTVGYRHALDASAVRSEWVLLLDAPLRLPHAEAILRAIRHAERERAALVWLVPRVRTAAWASPARLTSLADAMPAMAATNTDRPGLPLPGLPGLVRRGPLQRALREAGVALDPNFEGRLTAFVEAEHARARYVLAADELDAGHLGGPRLRESIERLLATVEFRMPVLLAGLAAYALLWTTALVGAFSDEVWGLFAAAGLATLAVPAWLVASSTRTSPFAALLAPLWLPVEASYTVFVALIVARRKAVRWRGRDIQLSDFGADDSAPDDRGPAR